MVLPEPGCVIKGGREQVVGDLRRLTALEREVSLQAMLGCRVAPEALCRRAIDVTRLIFREPTWTEVRGPRSLIAHVALASRADGIALGRHVFIRSRRYGRDGSLPVDLVAHEVTHVAQLLREGTLGFYSSYVAHYARGRARGLDDRRAYLAIPYEVEAREVAARSAPGPRG